MFFLLNSIALSSESFLTPHPLIRKENTKVPIRSALAFIPFNISVIPFVLKILKLVRFADNLLFHYTIRAGITPGSYNSGNISPKEGMPEIYINHSL
jgi:hypothetical protein